MSANHATGFANDLFTHYVSSDGINPTSKLVTTTGNNTVLSKITDQLCEHLMFNLNKNTLQRIKRCQADTCTGFSMKNCML